MKLYNGLMNLKKFLFDKDKKEECKRGQVEIQLSEELLQQQVREQRLQNNILYEKKRILASKNAEEIKIKIIEEVIPNIHPYCSVSLYRDVITIIWNDSSIFRSPNISIEQFNKIRECSTEEQILKIIDEKDNN